MLNNEQVSGEKRGEKSGLGEKLQVLFNEYNIVGNGYTYLPAASGALQACAQQSEVIRDNYQFMPFLYHIDNLDTIVEKVDNPVVAAFSVSMWNWNLSQEVAKKIKETNPKSLIIFGGPQVLQSKVPEEMDTFFEEHDFVDVAVRADGEYTFREILERHLETGEERDFGSVNGISYRNGNGEVITTPDRELGRNLDELPSPYLEGVFDELMKTEDINFQAIIELNRGCPFQCGYCYWGQGREKAIVKRSSMERAKDLAEWMGKKKIPYVYCADANFGMFKEDREVAQIFVDVKKKYGYPKRFRVCYGKNATDNIFDAAKILADADLSMGVTLSRQTSDEQTLQNILRKNIGIEMYDELQERYREANMTTYTELILGLPGETYDSFKEGLEKIFEGNRVNQLYVYHAQVLPNTPFASSEYQEKFGIQTQTVELHIPHSRSKSMGKISEEEEVIIATESMPLERWRESAVLAWGSQLFHSLKAGNHLSNYLRTHHGVPFTDFYEHITQGDIRSIAPTISEEMGILRETAKGIQEGISKAKIVPEFGNAFWDPEEAAYLRLNMNREKFYGELLAVTRNFLDMAGKGYDADELSEVIKYQKLLIPSPNDPDTKSIEFVYNVPEYMGRFFDGDRPNLVRQPQTLEVKSLNDFGGDKPRYAREIVLWGRKGERLLNEPSFKNTY